MKVTSRLNKKPSPKQIACKFQPDEYRQTLPSQEMWYIGDNNTPICIGLELVYYYGEIYGGNIHILGVTYRSPKYKSVNEVVAWANNNVQEFAREVLQAIRFISDIAHGTYDETGTPLGDSRAMRNLPKGE